MNKKHVGIISAIVIGIIIIAIQSPYITNLKDTNNQNKTDIKVAGEDKPEVDPNLPISEKDIQEKLNEIEAGAKNNTYKPAKREWISSGAFSIDRSKYVLGEKIFITAGGLGTSQKGQVAFMRPLNDTHYSVYMAIPFDGMSKNAFNFYLEPKLSEANHICTKDDLIGKWAVVFRGTNYPNLYFDIVDQILPGDEEKYNTPVC